MPNQGDLGFKGVILAIFLFGPVLVLVVRRRWRLAAARREEIMRLARLASEEAARAEIESILSYSTDSSQVEVGGGIVRPQCAVCYSPTTTRCSRCKAVRYCSGKCQILHWRQGHKEECHPPPVDDRHNDQGSISNLTGVQAEQSNLYDNSLDIEEKSHSKPIESFCDRPASSESNCSSEVFSEDNDLEAKPPVDTSGTESTSDTSTVSSSSSCSAFSGLVETSNDVSIREDPPQVIQARLGEPLSCDVSSDRPSTVDDVSETNLSKFPPSKFVNASFSVDSVSCSSKLDGPLRSSFVGFEKYKNAKPSEGTGECQNANLDSSVTQSARDANSTDSQFCQEGDCIQLAVGSSFQISNFSGQGILNPTHSGNEKSFHEAAPSEGTTQSVLRDSTALGFDKPSSVACGSSSGVCLIKSKGLRSLSSVPFSDSASSSGCEHSVSSNKSSEVDNAANIRTRSTEVTEPLPNGISDLKKTSLSRVFQQFKSSKFPRHYPSWFGSDISRKYNYKMLFPYDLFIKLYNCDKVELRPCGLTNSGNSCYANAVLQCLAFTRPLTSYLLQGLHTKTCPKKEWCFTCEFESLLLKVKQGKSPLSPIGILSNIHNIGSHLGHGREEDAHEFLRYAIDTMQSVCLKEAGSNAGGALAEETTLVQLIFGGYLRSKIKCMRCQGKSERRERMMDLTVEIYGDIGTLEEALARFTATEILDGENKYQCNRCKSYERAKKKLTVLEAPNVLTIALKRFQSGKFGKLNKAVRFPEILNLAPYMSRTNDKFPVYSLYAVVVHLDIMNAAFSGHYICYVKNAQGKWYKIDDSTVKPVELERVLSKGAYMLLYARCSPRAPSLIRNSMSHDLAKIQKRRHAEVVLSGHSGKSSILEARSSPTFLHSGSASAHRRTQDQPYRTTDAREPFELFDGRFLPKHRLQKDSSSDSSSLLSCSDEGSWSTESTRDSTSTEEFSEFIFGETGHFNWNSPLRSSEDSDGFTCSPLLSRMSDSPRSCDSKSTFSSPGREDARCMKELNYEADRVGLRQSQESREARLKGEGSPSFLYSNTVKQCRKLTEQCSSRETDWGNPSEVKSNVSLRRTSREKTTQTFY